MELELTSLLSKAKPEVAAAIRSKCSHSEHEQLKLILGNLLSPSNEIDDEEIIDWLTWIIAGGLSPEEFSSTVRLYDKATTCGLVWTENFVAYRCRTCGISPCMSLCTECFQHGNHEGHDFIVFRSETGGACDCGEINIIKESGCCSLHGPRGTQNPSSRTSRSDSNSSSHEQSAPIELLCIANEMMPHMFYRLLLSMREESIEKKRYPTIPRITSTCKHNNNNDNLEVCSNLSKGHTFIKMLQGLSDMGIAMRQVMINCLTNPPVYQNINVSDQSVSNQRSKTFLEELVYWTVKFEFPEDLIRLLLSMRSDSFYKEAFTRAFVIHYRLVTETILKSADPEKLCKHVAAVSVQLFSIEQLAVEMVEQERLLHLLIASLYDMINCTVIAPPDRRKSSIILDCDHEIMKNNYYWPIKSDLKELLSHQPVAMKFFKDEELLKNWFEFLSLFQGMNMSQFIEKGQPHLEQESETHIGAFTAELEISATPMWTLLSHLKDFSTAIFTKAAVIHCWRKLKDWTELKKGEISFHLPLHRNLSMFIHQGIQFQGITLKELLPSPNQVAPMMRQLIRLQSNFYQILGRLWTRNGTEVLNQAESYVNSLCCNSMIDADLFLLQITSTYNPPEEFLQIVFQEFGINEILQINVKNDAQNKSADLDQDEQTMVLESCLLFLATLTSVRTNLGMSDENVMALEMRTLLCKDDKLHSELMELLPERCGSDSQLKNFENILAQVADYQEPRNMQQGKYVPKPTVWKAFYDPIHTLLRSSNRSDFQGSLDRFEEYSKRSNNYSGSQSPWPPFRIPSGDTGPFKDPRCILSSGSLFEVLFIILYRAVHLKNIPNFIIALTVYLLELAISAYPDSSELPTDESKKSSSLYKTNNLIENLKTRIDVSSWSEKSLSTENIISLLLKLHSQLQGNSKSYQPSVPVKVGESNNRESEEFENRIGDGSFFTAKLLDRIMQKHPSLYQFVVKEINQTDQTSELIYAKEREEKRRKAKERKLQLMTEFAMKRQQFMKEVTDDLPEVDEADGKQNLISESLDSAYECVICKERGGSQSQNPFGLITYITPSSILAHRKPKDTHFSTPLKNYKNQCTFSGEEFERYFDNSSIKLTVPVDCGVGVCSQTCGHYIHSDCFTSYINSLRKSRSYILQKQSIQLNYKRFYCPLCRQIGNSFLPLIQDSLASASCSSDLTLDAEVDASELTRLLRKRNTLVLSPKQKQGVERFLDDLHKTITFSRCQLSPSVPTETSQTVSTIFLHSLDMEIERTKNKSLGDIKRSCLPPLYSILRYSYKSLSAGHSRKISQTWEIICGTRSAKGQKEVPILLSDLDLVLAHLVLQLPYGVEAKFLDVIVDRLCCLKLVQILCGLCVHLNDEELMEVKTKYSGTVHENNKIQSALRNIVNCLQSSKRYAMRREDQDVQSFSVSSLILNYAELESFVGSRMVPFLRRVELIKQFILKGKSIGLSTTGDASISMDTDEPLCNSVEVDFLRSTKTTFESIIPSLVGSIMDLNQISQWNTSARELFTPRLVLWDEPKLIDIPIEYDRIFQNYRKIQCQNCNSTPSEPALCLACGKIVCLNSFCCIDKQSKLSEVIHHSMECGMGTSIFLCVLSSAILVVVGNEACVWGSIFLDGFGEEDLDLKRGKPLFLSKERFQYLQRQWVTHSFLKSELKWFPHDNML